MANQIVLERADEIATVAFNRPDRRNAIDYEGWQELRRVVDDLSQDQDVKVVVITGRGDEAFSAGADIKDFERFRTNSSQARDYQNAFDSAVDAIEELPQPTICLIKGYCVGGGCELSLAADIRVAADNGRFGIPAARLGILIGYREMRRLVHLVGPGNASYILLSGRLIDAQEALRIGMVNAVIPLDDSHRYAYQLAREMAGLAPLSHRGHKQILRTVLGNPALKGLTPQQERLPFANFDTSDFQEGRRAFLERRAADFRGR